MTTSPKDASPSEARQLVARDCWETFQEAGLLWFVNRLLHLFGWSICVIREGEDGPITDAYPARTEWLGFPPDDDADGLERFRKHVGEDLQRRKVEAFRASWMAAMAETDPEEMRIVAVPGDEDGGPWFV